jgi:formylglycine-generating enzyme required for sulfatase activity
MGSPEDEPGRYGTDEEFLHEVEITQPFYLSIHPITQAQWVAVMGENPSSFQQGEDQPAIDFDTADLPVERISWELAHEFLKRLNADPREQQEGRRYRLPTEAEWEYAARGGPCSSGPFPFGDTLTLEHANFGASLREDFENDIPDLAVTTTLRPVGRPTKVGSYLPNAFGLYDMHGNVLNWCSDFFDADYYLNSPREDPQGPGEDEGLEQNCTRGGSWNFLANLCRSADRGRLDQGMQNHDVGIRPVLFFESRRVGT